MSDLDFENLRDSKFAELSVEQQFGNVFNQIQWFAKERNLTPLEVKEIFMDGFLLGVQNGKYESRSISHKELENLHANR
jgi:hypothetical protein